MPKVNANIQVGKYEEILAAVQSPVIALTELIKNASDSCQNNRDPIIVEIDTNKKTITITDSGKGFSKNDLENLGEAGHSLKMTGNNTRSPINNPLAGNKGLGILTAFFIANILEVETYSVDDRKSYALQWEKGTQEYEYKEIQSDITGTVVTLKNVAPEKLQLILLEEEKVKLFMASLRFFTGDMNLPRIRLIIDKVEEFHYPRETLESFYSQNKRTSSGFVAKATFRYSSNKIILSYEDNISGVYTFSDEEIDLSNPCSVDDFASRIGISGKSVAPIRSICESDAFKSEYWPIRLPEFFGVFYTWRNRKNEDIGQWPVGVRIYINNYSLYRYLDKENDWLNLSEISQNVKATNYKLKNTYGFLALTDYNENEEELKISKERNDFVDSMAQRKFIHIMRDVIIGVFTRIDMAVKNSSVQSFKLKIPKVTACVANGFDLSKVVVCNTIGLEDITLQYNEKQLSISKDWIVHTTKQGAYKIELSYGEIVQSLDIKFQNTIPEFSLSKEKITVNEGNSCNLRKLIDANSCENILPENIEIVPKNKDTIIWEGIFDKKNTVGQHIIYFSAQEFQRTLEVYVKKIETPSDINSNMSRISALFPRLDALRPCSGKLSELVNAISLYCNDAPTLCMAGVRILVESSSKAFFVDLGQEEIKDGFESVVDRVINIQDCHDNNNDYKTYISGREKEFVDRFGQISKKHNLTRDVKKRIKSCIKHTDLDMFVHNPHIIAVSNDVAGAMEIFAPLLNYIFDILIYVNETKNAARERI
jgi:ATP-binding region ATPase domain protein